MLEFQFPGMQKMAVEVLPLPVKGIAQDGVSQMLHVHPDLMGSSRVGHAGY
jgi:hypothetical protein